MKINVEKCIFSTRKIKYLGYTFQPGSIGANSEKIKSIKNWPTPKSKNDAQSFLGLAGFYQKLVPEYNKTILPLFDLTKNNVPWVWQKAHSESFLAGEKLFSEKPVVKNFDPGLGTIVETDASDGTIGTCLTQIHDGKRHPVAYESRKMKNAEVNYDTHD